MLKISQKKYLKNSAGALMTDKVPLAFLNSTIFEVEQYLKIKKDKLESINYIYTIDESGILKGAVSIKEVFRQGKQKKLKEFIEGELITVSPDTDGERVANLALEHNIKAIPVVDKKGKFLGAVLSDTILEIAYRETQEDLSRLAGLENSGLAHDDKEISIFASLKNRLPWLIIGLLGGFLMSKTITSFETTLAENLILASFIPLIVYIGSAVQTQIGYFIVRDLAFNPKLDFLVYAFRQLRIVLLIALGLSVLVFFSTFLFYAELAIAFVLALAVFLATLSSIITGVLIPFISYRLKFDPASASGPIATILQDLISIIIYLLVAKSLL
ncbi:magnesium transporter [Patescibacteria group bacterium]|nr:magnesium transporter [Patescibacteria group bacterium]